jgi:hypothetical protein
MYRNNGNELINLQNVTVHHSAQLKMLAITIPIATVVIFLIVWLVDSTSDQSPTEGTPSGRGQIGNMDSERGNSVEGSNNNSDNIIPVIPNLPTIEENPVSDFEYKAIAGGIEITRYIGTPVRVRIPETIEGVPVISIGSSAFRWSGIMEIHIPDSVISIGDNVFSNNEALSTVTIPNGVTSIGNAAFAYCIGLTSVNLPSSVTSIGDRAFQRCTNLISINLPDGMPDASTTKTTKFLAIHFSMTQPHP